MDKNVSRSINIDELEDFAAVGEMTKQHLQQ